MEGSSLQQSFAALREYFVGNNRHNNTANPAQLVIFAERAFKVSLSLINAHQHEFFTRLRRDAAV